MVNIIMPAYNGHNSIRKAISSVAVQDKLENIKLTIVDDCSDASYDYLKDEFSYIDIEVLRKKDNTGCGQSRQYGIEHCDSEYFMFLDTDDVLYTPTCVKEMNACMEKYQLDSLYTSYLEELADGNIIIHKSNGIHMHGKMFRTEYIKKNNIRFNNTRLNEDHAFNIISLLSGGKNMYIDIVTYFWRYNDQSLTREKEENPRINNKPFDDYFINAEYTITELIKRNVEIDKIVDISKKYILSFYKYLNVVVNNNNINIKEYCIKIKHFISILPTNISSKITIEYLLEDFYKDNAFIGIIDENIEILITFRDYFNNFIRDNLL